MTISFARSALLSARIASCASRGDANCSLFVLRTASILTPELLESALLPAYARQHAIFGQPAGTFFPAGPLGGGKPLSLCRLRTAMRLSGRPTTLGGYRSRYGSREQNPIGLRETFPLAGTIMLGTSSSWL